LANFERAGNNAEASDVTSIALGAS